MTRKATYSAIAAASLGLAAFTGSATAAELGDTGFSVNGSVTLTSDYVFRGFSQTDEDPALQGSFDLSHETGFYVGTWGSSVDFNEDPDSIAAIDDADEGAHLEIDYYGGFATDLGAMGMEALSVDTGIAYFTYPGAEDDLDYDYLEYYGTASYDFGVASVSAGFDLTDEFFGDAGNAEHFRAGVAVPLLNDRVTLSANIGDQSIDEAEDYVHYNLGASVSFAENYSLSAKFVDTDIDDSSDIADSRGVVSLSGAF